MGTYVGTFVNLYSTNSYFVYAWLGIVLHNAYIHSLFNPKQISHLGYVTSFYRCVCEYRTEHHPQSRRPPRLTEAFTCDGT